MSDFFDPFFSFPVFGPISNWIRSIPTYRGANRERFDLAPNAVFFGERCGGNEATLGSIEHLMANEKPPLKIVN
jgi:hypothetical protein